MKRIIDISFTYCYKASIILLIALIVVMLYYYYSYPFYGSDAGFYLNVIRDLGLGNKYFVDINVGYNPLGVFSMGLPYFLFGVKGKLGALFINHLSIAFSSLIIYKILIKFKKTKVIALFFALLFFALMLYYDGRFVILEPVTVLLQLGSLYSILKFNGHNFKKVLLSGIFLSLAFLSKQYALFLFPSLIYWLIINRNFLKALAYLIIGLLLPIILFYFYFDDTSLLDYVKYLLAQGTFLEFGTGTGKGYTPFGIPWLKIKKTLLINFYIFIVFVSIKNWRKDYKKFFFFISLPISSLSILYFAAYDHYYQLIIPYLILLTAYLIPIENISIAKKLVIMLIISISLFSSSRRIYNNVLGHKKLFFKQKVDTQIVKSAIPENTEVFLSGISPAYYYLGNFKSINLKRIGYSFYSYYHPKTITSIMNTSAVVIVNEEYLLKYKILQSNFEAPKKIKLNSGEFYILKKNNLKFY